MRQKKREFKKSIGKLLLIISVGMVAVCWQNLGSVGEAPAAVDIWNYLKNSLYMEAAAHTFPLSKGGPGQEQGGFPGRKFYEESILGLLPLWQYAGQRTEYARQTESDVTYEMLLAREGAQEGQEEEPAPESGEETASENLAEQTTQDQLQEPEAPPETPETETPAMAGIPSAIEPVAQVSREKLNDFDYLIQNFYIVDRTTTIDGSQLNAADLLARDMRLTTTSDQPQILLHHTHSQERFADSTEDPGTSIVGVGEYLTKILREKYGFNVIHDTGEYDVIDHDNAYSYAGPAIEQILAENPSIEVIIDMHRDAVNGAPLVHEVNGKQTAKIMFFNGLSRTTARGNLDYLSNPNLPDNLAFSLQMKIAAEEYYPGFTRPNFLKGYRYNLHYLPKSMLVEVGAQNNTVEEAMNAMEPLADLLYKVLMPQGAGGQ